MFAAQIGDRNAASHTIKISVIYSSEKQLRFMLWCSSCGQSELQPGLTPGSNVTVCRNGRLSQTGYTSKEFSDNANSNLSFTKVQSYEAEGPQGLKKPKYSTPSFHQIVFTKKNDTKIFILRFFHTEIFTE